MLKKLLLSGVVLAGLMATPRPALAGCTDDLMGCYASASQIDDFWSRTAAAIDCELVYADCVRMLLIGA